MSKKIALTQGKFAIVDDEDFEYINQWKWCALKRGNTWYAVRGKNRSVIMMHRVIMNTPIGFDTDHANGNGLDNQKYNLRICSHSDNLRNRQKNKNNTTGYKGVYKEGKSWRARIFLNGRTIHLGTFATKEKAAAAYDDAAKKHFGDFAKTNF